MKKIQLEWKEKKNTYKICTKTRSKWIDKMLINSKVFSFILYKIERYTYIWSVRANILSYSLRFVPRVFFFFLVYCVNRVNLKKCTVKRMYYYNKRAFLRKFCDNIKLKSIWLKNYNHDNWHENDKEKYLYG